MYDAMDVDDGAGPMPETVIPTPKQTPVLRGRKRFVADRDEIKAAVANNGLETDGFRSGDEEGSVEFKVLHDGTTLTTLSLQVTETSSYPNDHSYICFALDDVSAELLTVVEDIGTYPSKPLQDTLTRILRKFARILNGDAEDETQMDEDDDSGSEAGVEGLDDFDHHDLEFAAHGRGSEDVNVLAILKRDFLDVVGAGYHPGILKFGIDDFVLSVSVPVLNLQVPRALSQPGTVVSSRWPVIAADGSVLGGAKPRFHVGLSKNYKPSTASVVHAVRSFALRDDELEAEPEPEVEPYDPDVDPWEAEQRAREKERERLAALPIDENAFEAFSLSSSFDTLLDQKLLPLVKLRMQYGLGWAAAEMLHTLGEQYQMKPEDVYQQYGQKLRQADKDEAAVTRKHNLPPDPIREREDKNHINLLLVAFCYLIRRLTICTRYCLVCHRRIESQYEALKPYVCEDKLCTYQYYSLNFGPSIEYEVESNTEIVDLLVSLTYVSCFEGQMQQGMPLGMGLRVPKPATAIKNAVAGYPGYNVAGQPDPAAAQAQAPTMPVPDGTGLVDFDALPTDYQRASIVQMLDQLPAVAEMKKYLDKARGKGKVRLTKMDDKVPAAAWSLLRWCVASCTAYLEEIVDEDDMVHGIDKTWRQMRFSVGAPDAEAKFNTNVVNARSQDTNAAKFPSLYAFHGSPLRNWHSIIREGLQVRPPIHGRAYGNGVYFAKDGSVSMGHYAQRGTSKWKNSAMCPTSCVALAEIVNLPKQFVSSNPYFVVADATWIITRYLLVATAGYSPSTYNLPQPDTTKTTTQPKSNWVGLDPAHPLTLNQKPIMIPEQQQKLQRLFEQRRAELHDLDYDDGDKAVFAAGDVTPSARALEVVTKANAPPKAINKGPDWVHNEDWVAPTTYRLLPPPSDATTAATMAVQRELRQLLKEQQSSQRMDDLGWYMPPSLMSDNLFQWMVEMHSFDPELPIAKDMKAKGVNSLLFEIRFPPGFPHSPPFFRLVKPRLLPFLQGGGGHVTMGGSICMDLLVSDGWLPSYSIAAIMLQIKLAVSSTEPRPARLAQNWQEPYGVHEALEGFKRAARTHGWTVPDGTERLARY
ncbi:hypothetical protein BKA62DRAFT_706762 [Auriculariales sp. MPI-PUGE-AT-0066]|nr:hypothetical protein BKA62DRAFT_706762 [Auriculariales sp. MPI-PUGE-AT-0066]